MLVGVSPIKWIAPMQQHAKMLRAKSKILAGALKSADIKIATALVSKERTSAIAAGYVYPPYGHCELRRLS
jgi:hypothetical protein